MREQEDALISRALDHQASAGEWEQLQALARQDPRVWERLADALRVEGTMRRAVAGALDDIAPVALAPTPVVPRSRWKTWALPILCAVFASAGTALGFGWASAPADPAPERSAPGRPDPGVPDGGDVQLASSPAAGSEQPEAVAELGSVVRELPFIILESTPGANGVDLLVLERTLRQVHVDEFFEVHRDDQGVPAVLPAEEPPRLPRSSL